MLNAYLLNTVILNGIIGEQPPAAAQKDIDVRWQSQTLDTNLVVVCGEATDGSLVSGQAYDSDEVQKVGYRLGILSEPAVPTSALCQSVAEAIISRMRLGKVRGELSALPNCGIELFDVIEVADRWSNLERSRFRVMAVVLSYRREGGIVRQTLELGAV